MKYGLNFYSDQTHIRNHRHWIEVVHCRMASADDDASMVRFGNLMIQGIEVLKHPEGGMSGRKPRSSAGV